jgi:hypothetical protein
MEVLQILKKQTPVRQIVRPIEGIIADQALHDGELRYLVEYTGDDGETHQRWFEQSEVEEVK